LRLRHGSHARVNEFFSHLNAAEREGIERTMREIVRRHGLKAVPADCRRCCRSRLRQQAAAVALHYVSALHRASVTGYHPGRKALAPTAADICIVARLAMLVIA
jgi:hypothetical protein